MSTVKKIKHKVLGEGTYGCVIEEPLKCDSQKMNIRNIPNYKNKVSKVMRKKDAFTELKEMKKISTIKGIDKYAVNVPDMCIPLFDENFLNVVKKCRGENVKRQYKKDYTQLRILLLENGGNDLNTIKRNLYIKFNEQEKSKFFTSLLNLIEGIDFFLKNNTIHHDIKEGNLVYNINTGIAKFIDFGLATQKSRFIYESTHSINGLAVSHSYFPLESSCLNKTDFIVSDQEHCHSNRIDYNNDYDKFIVEAADSFDMYCLSLALYKLFREVVNFEVKGSNISNFLYEAQDMVQAYSNDELLKRKKDPMVLYKDYKELLEVYNLYSLEKPSPSEDTISLSKKYSFDLKNAVKDCPPTKPDYNPFTKKCVPECKTGKIRNDKFRCVNSNKSVKQNKQVKQSSNSTKRIGSLITDLSIFKNTLKNKTKKRCPKGTRRNKITGNCENLNDMIPRNRLRCPKGTRRNKVTGECDPIR